MIEYDTNKFLLASINKPHFVKIDRNILIRKQNPDSIYTIIIDDVSTV